MLNPRILEHVSSPTFSIELENVSLRKDRTDAKIKDHDRRIRKLENVVGEIAKELEMAAQLEVKADPFSYAHDDLDRGIITLLLEAKVITSTQIAEKLGENRHKIGKRLKRIEKESSARSEKWLYFEAGEKEGHYRAWWIIPEMIKGKS